MAEIKLKPTPKAPDPETKPKNKDPWILSDQEVKRRLGKDPFAIFKTISLVLLICSTAVAAEPSPNDYLGELPAAGMFVFYAGLVVADVSCLWSSRGRTNQK